MAKLIVALDYDNMADALEIANTLKGTVEWVKVGLELFVAEGAAVIKALKEMDYKVFVDLKLHDIPNTVKGAALALARHNADLLTVHVCGGEEMLTTTMQALKQEFAQPPLVFGITVLTSMSDKDFPYTQLEVPALANLYAKHASEWGINGIVCSGQEVESIKEKYPNLLTLCPGIRMADNASDDQKRIVTPYDAVKKGADFLVVGRPITKAQNPLEAAQAVLANMREAEVSL